jgi:2-dehydropantoate 2-reductase
MCLRGLLQKGAPYEKIRALRLLTNHIRVLVAHLSHMISGTKIQTSPATRNDAPEEMSSWHILGAGSIGCLWASHLRQSGHPVCLILKESFQRQSSLKPRTATVTLRHASKDEKDWTLPGFPILDISKVSSFNSISNLLITTKAHHSLSALKNLIDSGVCSTPCNFVFLQNGIGAYDDFQDLIGEATLKLRKWSIIVGSTTHGCRPSHRKLSNCTWDLSFVHSGFGNAYFSQFYPQGCNDPHSSALDDLNMPRLDTQTNLLKKDMETVLGIKLAVNCCINPLTALYRCSNGALLHEHRNKAWPMINNVCQETSQVLSTVMGPRKGFGKEELVSKTVAVCQQTALNHSSMLVDVEAGRETEIDYINGYIVKEACRVGLQVPYNQLLYSKVKELINKHGFE